MAMTSRSCEITAKGIILKAAPQGEYGRRLTVLTDRFGKITVFATGAAKSGSKLIGAVRPMTSAEFTLRQGKQAWNLHGVNVMASFDGLLQDVDTAFLGMYFLELTDYFAQEGMEEEEAKAMLNLLYLAFSALLEKKLSLDLCKALFELRLLVIEGEYSTEPPVQREEAKALWSHGIFAPLKNLFTPEASILEKNSIEAFSEAVTLFLKRQVPHKFKVTQVLQEL